MTIDNETVKKVAFLSRLKIDDNKIEETINEFNNILEFVDELKNVNTDNVEPLVSVNDSSITLRKDEVTEGNQSKDILANAPTTEYGYFAVPKVIE